MSSETPAPGGDGGSSSSSYVDQSDVSMQDASASNTSMETAVDTVPPYNPYLIDIPTPPPPPGTEDEVALDATAQNGTSTFFAIEPLYANYSTSAYFHATPPTPIYTQRAHPGFPYSFNSQPSTYAQYSESYYQPNRRYHHYYQNVPYPNFSQPAPSIDNFQPAPYQSYSFEAAPTAGYYRAIYSQADTSTNYFQDYFSGSYFQAGYSGSYFQADPLTSYYEDGLSTSEAQAVPSASYSEADPSTSYAEVGPTTTYAEAGPITCYSEADPATSYAEVGPSTSYAEAGPLTSYTEYGSSTTQPQAGASTEPQAGPSTEPQAGPSTEPQAGPSSEPEAVPSTSYASNFGENAALIAPREYPRYSQTYTIRVNNINYNTTLETLRHTFRPFGSLSDLYISTDPLTEASKGYAFVKYYDRSHAINAASAITGITLDGRQIRVEILEPGEQPEAPTTQSTHPGGSNNPVKHFTLKVTNIAYTASEDMLKRKLERTGTVEYISMPLRDSGLNKGYAYVRYARRSQAKRCLRRLHNSQFEGRNLIIKKWSNEPLSSASSDSDSD